MMNNVYCVGRSITVRQSVIIPNFKDWSGSRFAYRIAQDQCRVGAGPIFYRFFHEVRRK
jgi:hypothetical protein